jgi:hypothetical protein
MRKTWIMAGLVTLAIAGCGSSSSSSSHTSSEGAAAGPGHTGEWSQADIQAAKSSLTSETKGTHLSAAFQECLIKGLEEKFTPEQFKKDKIESKEEGKGRELAEACAKKYPPEAK